MIELIQKESLISYLESVLKLVEPRGLEQHDGLERTSSGLRKRGRGDWGSGGARGQAGSNGGGRREGGSPVQRWEKEQWEQ